MSYKKGIRSISLILIVFTVVLIVAYVIGTAVNDNPYSDELTTGLVMAELDVDTGEIEKRIKNIFTTTENELLSFALSKSISSSELEHCVEGLMDELGAVSVTLISKKYTYASYGAKTTMLSDEIKALMAEDDAGVSAKYEDNIYGAEMIAVYVPFNIEPELSKNEEGILVSAKPETVFDVALLVYRSEDLINKIFADTELHVFGAFSELFCFASLDGKVLYSCEASDNLIECDENVYKLINKYLTKSNAYFEESYIKSSINGSNRFITIDYNGLTYVGSFDVIEGMGSNYVVFAFYEPDLFEVEATIPETVFKVFSVFILIAFAAILAVSVIHLKIQKKDKAFNDAEESRSCANENEFYLKATQSCKRTANNSMLHSVIKVTITNLEHISDMYDDDMIERLDHFIGAVINRSVVQSGELYCSCDNKCNYLILLRHTTPSSLTERIKVVYSAISNNPVIKENSDVCKLCIGVSTINKGESINISERVTQANEACGVHEYRRNKIFVTYDSEMLNDLKKDTALEKKLNSELENGKFRIFFLPEYNLINDLMDGADIMLKLFESETKEFKPAEEITKKLSDPTAFTVKLERKAYNDALKLLADAIGYGSKISPISLSISKCHALTPDFASYYVSNKRKYNLPDNFITLQFSESFAFEEQKRLAKIINRLHAGGIRVAVTDVGLKHPSYKSLRDIGVDTLKLSSELLGEITVSEQEVSPIESLISRIKSFGFKTVQVGVTTRAEFNALSKLDCDVIQGDYYTKPIRMSDYITFVNGNTTIHK